MIVQGLYAPKLRNRNCLGPFALMEYWHEIASDLESQGRYRRPSLVT